MNIVLAAPTSTLKFHLNGTTFLREFKAVTPLFKVNSEFYLHLAASELYLVANDANKSVAKRFTAASCSGEGSFKIPKDILMGVLNKRADLKFKVANNTLSFAAVQGTYKGSISLEALNDKQLAQSNSIFAVDVAGISLPDYVFAGIDAAIRHANIKDSYGDADAEMIRYITGEGSRIEVLTFDQYHAAWVTTTIPKPLKTPFTIAVYQSYFSYIGALAQKERFKVSISDKYFYIYNNNFFLSLPPIQYELDSFNMSKQVLQSLLTTEHPCSFTFEVEKFKNIISNLCSVYEHGSALSFAVDQHLELEFSTSFGTVKDCIQDVNATSPLSFNISALPLRDTLQQTVAAPVTFSVLPTRAYVMRQHLDQPDLDCVYINALLQDRA